MVYGLVVRYIYIGVLNHINDYIRFNGLMWFNNITEPYTSQ